jgi:16S rRNA (cytosine1402-N4)-methyltransferase
MGYDQRPGPLHRPVLTAEAIHFLAPERGGTYVDCTVGLGGHAAALLTAAPAAELVGIDRDPQALAHAAARLAPFGARARLVLGTFAEVGPLLASLGIDQVAGILADLGVSSLQLETAERGFSFGLDGPLDMRMGKGELTARDIVNRYPEDKLAKIFREYGEEPQARRLARKVVEQREAQPFTTTTELRQLIERVKGPAGKGPAGSPRRTRQPGQRQRQLNPATLTFQALRLEVNQELEQLRLLIDQSMHLLSGDGRLVIISYHSLEDRIVKHMLRYLAQGEVEPVTGRPRMETQVIES